MRGERGRGRKADPAVKALDGASAADPPVETPPTWKALADLFGVVGRSGAPQLRLRIIAALALTLTGKALGVAAPVVLGIAVNELAAG